MSRAARQTGGGILANPTIFRAASVLSRWSNHRATVGWQKDVVIALILIAGLIVMPHLGPQKYTVTQFTLAFIWIIVVSQWNLVFGVAGIFSLAQMAIFAFGGFATGMFGLYLDWSLWAALPVAAFGAMIFSLLIGLACLRLRGPYVALLTLAIALVMLLLIQTDTACFYTEGVTCRNFTGGARGLAKFGDFGFREMFGRKFFYWGNYYLALFVLVISCLFAYFVTKSPIGMAFKAMRDNPEYAVSRGLNRFKNQLLVFASSAFFTGIAGGVYAGNFRVIGGNVLDFGPLLLLICMMVVGGLSRPWGPILGGVLIMMADELMKDFLEYRNIGLGAIIVLFVVFLPSGLAGAIDNGWRSVRRSLRDAVEARSSSSD